MLESNGRAAPAAAAERHAFLLINCGFLDRHALDYVPVHCLQRKSAQYNWKSAHRNAPSSRD
jgi:hypothetical protein